MKQIKIGVQIFILLLITISCKKENEEIIIESENSGTYFQKKINNLVLMDSLHNRIVEHGDTLAYYHIQGIYNIAEEKRTSALYYAIIMANKYHYNQAYNDVYQILNSKKMDNETKKLAEEYLKKYKTKKSKK
ncbi:MAG: hypothetical protein EOO44_12905 [Flavobacterium sp.]|nr:MAG: hypothetical protein EOO44_12905 [Flavobacterium sp.]